MVGWLCLGTGLVLAALVASRSYRRRRAREKMARIRYHNYNTIAIYNIYS